MSETLKTYVHQPSSSGDPKQIIILLHGVGADGQDLIGLARMWDQALPNAVFVSPDAPFPYDMAPFGRQWFSLREPSPDRMLQGIETAAPILSRFIDEQLQNYGLTDEQLALVGFSQGTMMSLFIAPRRSKQMAGVLGYSGALFGGEDLSGQDIQKPPTHLIHGEADPVVPVAAFSHAKETLTTAGFAVSGMTIPGLQHGIDDAGLESGQEFLLEVFQ